VPGAVSNESFVPNGEGDVFTKSPCLLANGRLSEPSILGSYWIGDCVSQESLLDKG